MQYFHTANVVLFNSFQSIRHLKVFWETTLICFLAESQMRRSRNSPVCAVNTKLQPGDS